VDATAMFDLLVAGRGSPVGTATQAITELAAWARCGTAAGGLRCAATSPVIWSACSTAPSRH